MKDLHETFGQYLHTIGYKKNSCNMMVYALKEFTSETQKRLEEITKKDMEVYSNYLETRPNKRRSGALSSSMLRHYLYGLKVFFSWCEQTNKISINPMSGFVLPEVENLERVILTRIEIARLYEACASYQQRAILGLFYGCGLRRSEGEALDYRDIDFVKSVLYVRSGKGGKRRVIPIGGRVKVDLLNYTKEDRPALEADATIRDIKAFLLNKNSRRMSGNTCNKILRKLLSKAGIKKQVTLHGLRHSIATHLLEKGLELEQVRDFLGHSNLETTQIYLHDKLKKLSG